MYVCATCWFRHRRRKWLTKMVSMLGLDRIGSDWGWNSKILEKLITHVNNIHANKSMSLRMNVWNRMLTHRNQGLIFFSLFILVFIWKPSAWTSPPPPPPLLAQSIYSFDKNETNSLRQHTINSEPPKIRWISYFFFFFYDFNNKKHDAINYS